VIANATRIPFLLVLFGVLGGIAAFGLVGLFLGPVILAVLMAVWREYLGIPHPQPHVHRPTVTPSV
jgi:predicted PurR-regulated permease PerM